MIVVDASVAVKWTVVEGGHEEALSILDRQYPLIAPDLLFAELANVLRRKLKQMQVADGQPARAVSAVRIAIPDIVSSGDLVDDALSLAAALDHSVYDCFYLACALPAGVLATADLNFIEKCERGGYGRFLCRPEDAGEWLARRAADALPPVVLARVERLATRVEETFASLEGFVRPKSEAGRPTAIDVAIYGLVFDSPAYRRLERELDTLAAEEIAVLVALGWLGRRYHEPSDWPWLLANARDMVASDAGQYRRYFMAQMPDVSRGFAKLRAGAESDPEIRRDT